MGRRFCVAREGCRRESEEMRIPIGRKNDMNHLVLPLREKLDDFLCSILHREKKQVGNLSGN